MARVRSYIISPNISGADEEDLTKALQSLVNTVRSPHTPPLQLDHDETLSLKLPTEHVRHVVQIAREAISNALRHA